MKLKFASSERYPDHYSVDEDGKSTETVKFEHLGLIFEDELGVHWNISDDYSGIIELEELIQIINFMEQLKKDTKENKQ